jgi:predicted Abi (CAAX) family protease
VNLLNTIGDRFVNAVITLPAWQDWFAALAWLGIYALVALGIGCKTGFLQWTRPPGSLWRMLRIALTTFFFPAVSEESFFRVLLLPAPDQMTSMQTEIGWSAIALALFVIYHPLNAQTFFPAGRITFTNPTFLVLAALLGGICTIVYRHSASLWVPVLVHWSVVVTWLLWLGGYRQLYQASLSSEDK